MDEGLEERKKVEEIKNAIKAAKVYNRLLHHSDTGSTAQCNVYETHDSGIVQQLQSEKSALDNRCSWNSNYSSETDPIQHIQPDGINQSTKTITEPDYGQNSFDCDEGLSSLYMVFEGDLSLNAYTPSLQTTNLSPTETQPECLFDNVLDLTPLPSTPILSPSKDDFEFEKAVLLIRYMDNVLYIQFPFYNDALSHHGRGWVLSLITTVKPIYYTALALSSYHRDAENCQGNKTKRYELYWENYTRAIIKLRQYIISASDSDAVAYAFKVSFCILQLIFCELFRGEGNWQMHLQAASSLMTPLSLLKPKTSTVCFEQSVSKTKLAMTQPNAIVEDRFGVDTNQNAIDTLVGAFVALDMLPPASTRTPSLLRADYKHWLSDRNIQMHHLMGCNVTVMLLISQISELEQWKREWEARNSLSIMELSKRASSIEAALVDFIAGDSSNVREAISALNLKCPTVIPTPNTTELNNRVISSVFACSAITYLHVVVSGTHLELNEIRQSISQTLLVLKSLPNPQLLRYMVWPFCITGCLVSHELENELRDMAILAGASETGPLGTMGLWKSLEIMEDCWNRRDQNGGTQDWTAAMSRLGNKVLLF